MPTCNRKISKKTQLVATPITKVHRLQHPRNSTVCQWTYKASSARRYWSRTKRPWLESKCLWIFDGPVSQKPPFTTKTCSDSNQEANHAMALIATKNTQILSWGLSSSLSSSALTINKSISYHLPKKLAKMAYSSLGARLQTSRIGWERQVHRRRSIQEGAAFSAKGWAKIVGWTIQRARDCSKICIRITNSLVLIRP